MQKGDYIATHSEPIWRERANFIIAADIAENNARKWEQLWARQLSAYRFEICCIPFFIYDLDLGDVIETDRNYVMTRVVERSGHYTFRAWFGASSDFDSRHEIERLIRLLGCGLEWSSRNLLAISAPGETVAQEVADLLLRHEESGGLVYETGRTR